MKTIFTLSLFVILGVTYAQKKSDQWFAFKGKWYASMHGGAAEMIGSSDESIYPLINPAIGYHMTDRFSLVAESIFYFGESENGETTPDSQFENATQYGIAVRYYTRKNLKCGTLTLQTGGYMYEADHDEAKVNWLFTPGWIYPLGKSEKLFAEITGDIQMNKVIQGEVFLMAAKVGVSYHF